MKTVQKTVVDIRKLTDEEIGKLFRKANEIVRRSNEGTISFEESLDVIQKIAIEGKSSQHLDVVKGLAEIVYPEHLIDTDVAPFIPEGFTLVEHKRGGLWKWNPNTPLYLSKNQKKGGYSTGNDLRKELAKEMVLNANVLDYLLAHLELIPEEWKGKCIFFWGTVFRRSDGNLYVRYLLWNGYNWSWGYSRLGSDFGSDCPAALAS